MYRHTHLPKYHKEYSQNIQHQLTTIDNSIFRLSNQMIYSSSADTHCRYHQQDIRQDIRRVAPMAPLLAPQPKVREKTRPPENSIPPQKVTHAEGVHPVARS